MRRKANGQGSKERERITSTLLKEVIGLTLLGRTVEEISEQLNIPVERLKARRTAEAIEAVAGERARARMVTRLYNEAMSGKDGKINMQALRLFVSLSGWQKAPREDNRVGKTTQRALGARAIAESGSFKCMPAPGESEE